MDNYIVSCFISKDGRLTHRALFELPLTEENRVKCVKLVRDTAGKTGGYGTVEVGGQVMYEFSNGATSGPWMQWDKAVPSLS